MKLNRISAVLLAGVLSATTLLTGCNKIDSNATLVKMGEGEPTVSLGYYNFSVKYQQALYDLYYTQYFGDKMWTMDMGGSDGETMEDSVKSGALDTIRASYLSQVHASEYGIELTDADKARISEVADNFMNSNNSKAIRLMGATKEYVEQFLTEQYYRLRVQKAFKESQDITISDEEANQSTIKYAFFSTEGTTNSETGETVELTDAEKEELKSKAQSLTSETDETAFDEKASEYGAATNTYSFTTSDDPAENTLGEEVIKAALALNDGQTSGVITREGAGYYVIRMVAKKDAEATENKRAQLVETAKSDAYDELVESWKEGTTWEVKEDLLKKIKIDQLFEMSASMQDALNSEEAAE